MVWFILGILVLVAAIVGAIEYPKYQRRMSGEAKKKISVPILAIGIVVSIALILISVVVTLEPGEVGIAYRLNGTTTDLTVGYNYIEPWSRKHSWNTTMQVLRFSQGEAADDIYGAQTSDKDYIEAVASMGVHIDTTRLPDYIALYGNEQINSERITTMLKTVSRNSIESAIGQYSTADVMSNKKKIGEEAEANLKIALADLPIVLDYFTIDDLIAPDSYEAAIREQAQLRMDKEKATLQQEINEQEALANKIKAEGEAEVRKTEAQAAADVKKIEAENAASVKQIQAENEASVAKIKAESEAAVVQTKAEAKAKETTTIANAEAEAVVLKGEAEAKAITAQGEAYKANPELIDLKKVEIQAEVDKEWATKWSGFSFEGMSGFNFTNLTEILQRIIPGAIPVSE